MQQCHFDAALRRLPAAAPRLAASFSANGWTAGSGSLAGDAMRRAGMELLADRLGLATGGNLTLEDLAMAEPALIITASRYAQPSRAEEILTHPVLDQLSADRLTVPDRDWICGLPQLATTIERLMQ